MRKRKPIIRAIVSSAFVFALTVSSFAGVELASAAGGTATWIGGGSDNKFSTAANWEENAVPEDGDALIFNTPPASVTSIIDDVDISFSSVTISGTDNTDNYPRYELTGDLNLEDGATWSDTSDGWYFQLDFEWVGNNRNYLGNVVSEGDFVLVAGFRPASLTISGVATAKSGTSMELGISGATGYVIENGAQSQCNPFKSYTTPITLGGGSGSAPVLSFGKCMGGSGGADPAETATLSKVTLLDNAKVDVYGNDTIKVLDLVKNGHTLTRTSGSDGVLITPDGIQKTTYPKKTTKLSGNKSSEDVTIYPNETAILSGKRGYIFVRDGGTLKGTGTMQELGVRGVIAPGNSPGTITVLDHFTLNQDGTYEAEILNKKVYDQIKAGDVNVYGQLKLSFIPGGKVNKGDAFTIINNTGSNPVNGTFSGLPEGSKIALGKAVFAISYEGGSGNNDVVLTALTTATAPGTPNTGFSIARSNPVIVALLGIVSVALLAILARRKVSEK